MLRAGGVLRSTQLPPLLCPLPVACGLELYKAHFTKENYAKKEKDEMKRPGVWEATPAQSEDTQHSCYGAFGGPPLSTSLALAAAEQTQVLFSGQL